MIEFVNISKKFQNHFWEKNILALDNVSFQIHEGDLVGFLGANGAGKTTLIKILMDFSRQTSGELKFDSILGESVLEIKSNIGYLPERAYLYQHLTGREFLEYTGSINSIPKNDLKSLIKKWSEKIMIDYALDRQIKGYSKGMQQRLGFISALIHSPKFLVLDEPLSGLDPVGRRDFKNILKELNENGTTIFFSSHIVSDVEEICNKVIFIEKGKLLYDGDIDSLILKHSSDQYRVRYVKGESIETIRFEEKEKNQILNNFLQENVNILELEKDKPTLEEIIYKIKK
ncbi:ABC transporter ATP-binding protein [Bacteriovorax sp. PP10]|uniref:ABC transporter ATP-binding protein n=1 Tax=Bacteriovorax antarcticus TaxID=3088717 RepID=A0ABU5VNQ4_9BACT|nr:ABC transporter ATP-binding protein [Bacteriovorax sp. PP10]MEA9354664.1 ABC transporter ATP-binding protein [Bacteriovorax sp. PP10]